MGEKGGKVVGGLIISESERLQNSERVTRENTEKFVEMKINSALDGLENIVAYFVSQEKRFPNKFEAIALHHQMKLFLDKLHIGGGNVQKFFRDFFVMDDEVKEYKTSKIIYVPIIDEVGARNEAVFELVVTKKDLKFKIKPARGNDGEIGALSQEIEDRDFGD